MDTRQAQELLQKHREGRLSPEEKVLLDNWYIQYSKEQFLPEGPVDLDTKKAKIFSRLQSEINYPKPRLMWPKYAAAASIIIALSATAYFYFKPVPVQQQVAQVQDIAPIQKGVTLTLNGRNIQLTKIHSRQIAKNIVQADSSLEYTATAEPVTNTLTNNGNSKFSVKLADGSDITLDIGSSLTYPSAFTTNVHEVKLIGQAYFKVKHNPNQRFIVKTKDQTTEDIGTEFNINAYSDEPAIRTTLLEGSIKVNDRILKPGQQAVNNDPKITVTTADIEEVTAWLQDKIVLEQQTLETIMRKVARIYGVKVIYMDEEVKNYTYGGAVKTSTKLSEVLKYLRKAGGVDFKVEGQTIKVFTKKKGS